MATKKMYFDAKGLSLFNYKFEIRDENGTVCYKAETVTESMIRYNAKLYNAYDQELVKVSQQKKMTLATMNFDLINSRGELLTEAIQKMSMINYTYNLTGYGLVMSGNFLKMSFDFTRNGQPVAHVRKKMQPWGDSYEVEMFEPELEPIFLAGVLMIQLVLAASRNRQRRR